MMRRKVAPTMLQGLVEKSQQQEVTKGIPRTMDPNFPVFTTPVNEDILVYFPKTNVIVTQNGEEMQTLKSFIHNYKVGNSYGAIRCINGFMHEELGYDGTCPACDAVKECWELYNRKLEAEAKRLGIGPQNDPTDALKSVREKILLEMDIKNAEEYVTFPIVIIPTSGKFKPTEDAINNLQPVYVTWTRKRYENTILETLASYPNAPAHPAGMFWLWKFSYNTGGKQPNARDSAKNAKYNPIMDEATLAGLRHLIPACEEKAKDFTLIKAVEVLTANQFLFKEDYEAEINKIMVKTRQLLEMTNAMGNTAPTQPQITAGANPLLTFGEQPTGNIGLGGPIKFGE